MAYIGQDLGLGTAERYIFTASGNEVAVSTADDGRVIGYTAGQVSVYLNGVKLVVGTDCIATDGSTITGLSALVASDVVEVIALSAFSPSDTVSASGGTFTGNVIVGASGANQTIDVASHDLVDGGLKLGGTLVTASATELNKLDGVTSTTAQLNAPTTLGTVTAGTIGSTIPLVGMSAIETKMKAAHATTAHHTWTVSNSSKYFILFQLNHISDSQHQYPAIAEATVNGSGSITITFTTAMNSFGTALTVTSPSANQLKWQSTHTWYSTNATLIKVGGN